MLKINRECWFEILSLMLNISALNLQTQLKKQNFKMWGGGMVKKVKKKTIRSCFDVCSKNLKHPFPGVSLYQFWLKNKISVLLALNLCGMMTCWGGAANLTIRYQSLLQAEVYPICDMSIKKAHFFYKVYIFFFMIENDT